MTFDEYLQLLQSRNRPIGGQPGGRPEQNTGGGEPIHIPGEPSPGDPGYVTVTAPRSDDTVGPIPGSFSGGAIPVDVFTPFWKYLLQPLGQALLGGGAGGGQSDTPSARNTGNTAKKLGEAALRLPSILLGGGQQQQPASQPSPWPAQRTDNSAQIASLGSEDQLKSKAVQIHHYAMQSGLDPNLALRLAGFNFDFQV